MRTVRTCPTAWFAIWVLSTLPLVHGDDEIPAHRARQIYEAAPEKPTVEPKAARRVLIFNTPPHLMPKDPHKGYCIPYGSSAFEALGKKSGAYTPVISDDLAMFLPNQLGEFDAVVLNNTSGAWITPTEDDLKKEAFRRAGAGPETAEPMLRNSLLDYVRNGGGLVAVHFAIGANRHWPEFRQLLGATFTGHPWNEEVGLRIEEPDHPLVQAFGGPRYRLADEIYQYGDPYDRSQLRVLISLDTERTNMGVRWIQRTDGDFALAWVKDFGRGRVFYTSFGHRTELFWNPALLRFYLNAVQFATGDLSAPTAPRPDRPVMRFPGPTPPEIRAERMQARNVVEPTEAQVEQIRAAAPNSAPAKPAKPRKVLVWGRSWTHQPNPFAERALAILGEKTGAFQATVTDDPRFLLADRLPTFDALVMNNIHENSPFLPDDMRELDPEQRTAAEQFDAAVKQSILDFVRSGKGLIGIHAATAALHPWPEYGQMLGGFYGGHIHQQVAIRVEDPQHPVNACFEGKPWEIRDEIYIFREPYSRDNLHVLLSLDLQRMEDPGKRADKDYAVSWVRREGEGRVFYTTLGHDAATYWNPMFLQHVLAGVQFAIGDLQPEAP
jgi:type 1 glutamine amidotransferase